MPIDSITGYEECPLSEAPAGPVILAKSKNGVTYMSVWMARDGVWCLDGTREVARPKPHTWLKPPEQEPDTTQLREIAAEAIVELEFLQGVGPLRGVQFGDLHPDRRGVFWWRSELAGIVALVNAAEPMLDELERLRAEVAWLRRKLAIADPDSRSFDAEQKP